MKQKWTRLGLMPLLAIGLWMAGCSDLLPTADPLMGPGEVQQARRTTTTSVRAVHGVVPADSLVRADSAVFSSSGRLYVAGNELFVPGGAVKKPTMFKMRLKDDGTVGVDLRAFQQDAAGNWTVDVGAQGFNRPLQLTLSYEFVTERGINVDQLLVAWRVSPTDLRPVTSWVVKTTRDVYAELDHFSEYVIAMP